MIEPYNEDYFYFNHNNENWWEHNIFKDEDFLKFKDMVYWYFDNELSVNNVLIDFICDDNGNDLEYNNAPVARRLDLLICFGYKKGENVSNVATSVMEWLVYNKLMEQPND